MHTLSLANDNNVGVVGVFQLKKAAVYKNLCLCLFPYPLLRSFPNMSLFFSNTFPSNQQCSVVASCSVFSWPTMFDNHTS